MEIKIKRKYQKKAATATTIQALFCRIHPLWNSTEGNTAVFPEICFMFAETKGEIQSFDFQLTIDKHRQGWHNYCSGLLREEKGHLELKVKTRTWPQPEAHPPLTKDSTVGEGLQHPPKIWSNFPQASSLGLRFLFALLQGRRARALQEALTTSPM